MDYPTHEAGVQGFAEASKALIKSTRPKQWTKNLLVFLALFFTIDEAWDPTEFETVVSVFGKAALGFVVFSMLAGAIYLINDAIDIDKDRRHPKKRSRPIAAGQVPLWTAWAAAGLLITAALAVAFLFVPLFGVVSVAYVATMIAYSLVLKQLILLDVFAISAGFVLRVVAGAVVIQVPISPWLYICTGLGALLIALAKRRGELTAAGGEAASQRPTLEWYTTGLLDQLITAMATAVVLAYTLYTFTAPNLPVNNSMMLTIPLVVYGLFRYLYLIHTKNLGEHPEDIILSDIPLIACVLLWLAASTSILVVYRG